ncbi:MAG: diacylglycerol/lipid kinase family protein [Roseiflexaceae bacterium]
MSYRVCVIANHHAGQAAAQSQALQHALELWRAHGWHVDERYLAAPGDAERFAHNAVVQQYDLVVAAGGDGTVNEVANALVATPVVLAPLPIGTVNVWAREAGFSMDVTVAAQQILDGVVGKIDVGRANGRAFLLMTGIGFDAEVVRHLYASDKRKFGVLAYIGRIWSVMWSFRSNHVTVTLDDDEMHVPLLMMVVGNTQRYAGFIPFTPTAQINDGLLDVKLMFGHELYITGVFRFLMLYVYRYLPGLDRHTLLRRVQRVMVTGAPMSWQVDGDYVGSAPIDITVQPAALRVVTTPAAARRLQIVPVEMERV